MKIRSAEETKAYLSDDNVFIPLFKELRGYLKSKLIQVSAALKSKPVYWTCGLDHHKGKDDEYFKYFQKFCTKRDLDFLATLNTIDEKVGYFYCKCQMVNHCDDENLCRTSLRSRENGIEFTRMESRIKGVGTGVDLKGLNPVS